jgi:Rod binding domain-containing protein
MDFNKIDLNNIKSYQDYVNYNQAQKSAKEFEAIFLNMMLSEMFKTATKNPFLGEEGSGVNNTQKEMMFSLLTQQLSQQWAQDNSLLSDQILQQLNNEF